MKLKFAENLRKMRRENGFTQEQLAEKVGVSFQTVSRWETGVVYPDIETLPILAEIFETRVDELIGCTKNDKESLLAKRWEEYEKLTDAEEQYAFLREMKRDFPKEYLIPYTMMQIMYYDKIHVDELCAVFEDFSALCKDKYDIDFAQEMYISLEEEGAAMRYIKSSGMSDNDASKYLQSRYFYRKEWAKYDLQRQINLLDTINNFCYEQLRKREPFSAQNSLWAVKKSLALINMLCDCDSDNLITGGKDEPDLWAHDRSFLGFRLAAALAATGDKEGAYEAIEASISLAEKISALPDGTVLTYASHTLDRITGKLYTFKIDGITYRDFALYDGEEKIGKNITAIYPGNVRILAERKGWEWFDSIREEERYKALVERFKKAVI